MGFWLGARRRALRTLQQQRRLFNFERLEQRVVLSAAPPTVVSVEVASTAWSANFNSYLQSHSLGSHGYQIPTGSAQAKPLPWKNLDKIFITFSEDVAVQASDLSITGVGLASNSYADFSYDAITHVAAWTLAVPLARNSYQLDLDGDGLDPVRGMDGQVLDGEWSNNADAFPSGNGVAGGDFQFVFKILQADVNQSSTVGEKDYSRAFSQAGFTTSTAGYQPLNDVDGNGAISSADLTYILDQDGTLIPPGAPIGVTNDAPSAYDSHSIQITDATDYIFSLWDNFQDAETPDSQLTYEMVSNSNPSLFDSVTINTSTGSLILSAAPNQFGQSQIIIKATDSTGQVVQTSLFVDVTSSNAAPEVCFVPEFLQGDTFRIVGAVTDDGPVAGLLVVFSGSINMQVTTNEDGTFDFEVEVPQANWGEAQAIAWDWYGVQSLPFHHPVGL
jgi:hypothetical protein